MKHRKYEYISNSKNITIKVEKMDNSAKGVSVAAYYGDKLALFAPYKELILTEDKANDIVKHFCETLLTFTENDIQEHIDEKRIMIALNVRRSLKEVRNKLGKTIWRRKGV
jgi:hypothetical protein